MVLPLLLGLMGSAMSGAGMMGGIAPLLAGAIGTGLGTTIETGDIGKGLGSGLTSYLGGSMLGSLGGKMAAGSGGITSILGSEGASKATGMFGDLAARQGANEALGMSARKAAASTSLLDPSKFANMNPALRGGISALMQPNVIASMANTYGNQPPKQRPGRSHNAPNIGTPSGDYRHLPDGWQGGVNSEWNYDFGRNFSGGGLATGHSGGFGPGSGGYGGGFGDSGMDRSGGYEPGQMGFDLGYSPDQGGGVGDVGIGGGDGGGSGGVGNAGPARPRIVASSGQPIPQGGAPLTPATRDPFFFMQHIPNDSPYSNSFDYSGGKDYVFDGYGDNTPAGYAQGGVVGPSGVGTKEVVKGAVRAIQGVSRDPKSALGLFVSTFGENALSKLIADVQDGKYGSPRADTSGMTGRPGSTGMVNGVGDGMSDSITGNLNGNEPVGLSDGEFVVPADVVSHLGNGSSQAGAGQLDAMMSRIRQAKGGSPAQPQRISAGGVLPA